MRRLWIPIALLAITWLIVRALAPSPRPSPIVSRSVSPPSIPVPAASAPMGLPGPRTAEAPSVPQAKQSSPSPQAPVVELSADCADLWSDLKRLDLRDFASASDLRSWLPDKSECPRLPTTIPQSVRERHYIFRGSCLAPPPRRSLDQRIWAANCARAALLYRDAIRGYLGTGASQSRR